MKKEPTKNKERNSLDLKHVLKNQKKSKGKL